ncbi:chemotaxis protein CheX [Thiospirochaeta perfilievii]|uniref:Chemotaxis protein CheX n=1 Tax=Thiospirochaeta perfilievii TaxID=252967 RepID=A0A5C1Q584_9SPIO|nr:chemotaxis protein CheX [Thiospirochaeta perfilievii]QEN03223.1 chemotaxis protein CheX [Thiospirochaeta perfilievii]
MYSKINESFIEVTKNIFQKLFSTEIMEEEIYTVDNKNHKWDISGVVGVVGDYEGVVSIRLLQTSASKLLEKSRVDSPEISVRWNLINDMIGEVVNNITGNVLSKISKNEFTHSVPITIQGENHILQWPKEAPILAIPFKMDYGVFEVQYSLVENK